jgi:hypothetical protein
MSLMSKALMSVALPAVLALGACAKPAAQASASPAPAASSAAPVVWDMASNDPAKNPVEANKEGTAPGYNP